MVKYEIYTYDKITDSLFLSFPINYKYNKILKIEEEILIELDNTLKPRAIEILNASKKFKSESKELENIKTIEMEINITQENIQVNITLELKNNKKTILIKKIKNTTNIPTINNNLKITV